MGTKDTKYTDLNTNLSAVGKAVFANFYYDFKDTSISDEKLADKLYQENPGSRSNRQNFRIPRARHIFELGQQLEALQIIINSERVDEKARKRAKEILASENDAEQMGFEAKTEREFIEKINKEIIYSDNTEFEYDNTHQKPKHTCSSTIISYQRDKKVSKNALLKAKYLCEVDSAHFVFRRKNSSTNYTEPHHLVPLYAQKDFPDVNLDREQNIVSLCSSCHNLLHYGADIDSVLFPLYMMRKDLLNAIGISISYEQLKKYYQ